MNHKEQIQQILNSRIAMNSRIKKLRRVTKIAYQYRGFARLAEKIRNYYSQSSETYLIEDFDENLFFYCALDEHMGSQIFWRGFYSEYQLSLLRHQLKPEMIFVDVGANHGEFTVFAAKRLTKGKVIAFEPVSALFQKLERNVRANGFTNVMLVKKGLSNQNGDATIYTTEQRFLDGTKHEGLHTIYSTSKRSEPYETIELTTLDEFAKFHNLTKVDIIKIDVEGAELAVLQGARNTIKNFKPIIIMEINEETSCAAGYSPRLLLDYLAELGYSFEVILPKGRTKPILPEQLGYFQNVICFPQ